MKSLKSVYLWVMLVLLVALLAGCGPTAAPAPEEEGPAAAPVAEEPAATPATEEPEPAEEEAGGSTAGGELVVGLAWEPSKIDPHRTAADNGLLPVMQACESLVIMASDGSFVPGLATSWEISEDGAAYTFQLREGVTFHDGTPFNAEAVKYNFDRIVDPATQSEQAIDKIGPYVQTEIIDDYTAVVRLESPFAAFLDGISGTEVCMVSPTAAAEWGPEEFQDHFVGTGPFIFKEWVRQEHIRLEKNPDYWGGPEFFEHQGTAYLDAVVFKFVGESSVRTGTLETGEIQVAQDVPAIDVARLSENPDIEVVIKPSPGQPVMFLFNMSKAPTDDLRVRQAINYAVDQQAISDTLYEGVLGPAYGPFSPTTPCYWAGAEEMYLYDPEQAKALLEEAGWTDTDGDGIRDKDGQPLLLDFPTHGDYPALRDPLPIIQAQLREVGIDVNIMNLAVPAWLEAGRTGNQHMGIMEWRVTDPDFARVVFHSENTAVFAWNFHNNAELDELIMQGMVTTDPEERCALYEQAQQIIMEEAMIKSINLSSAVWAIRNNVTGLTIHDIRTGFFWAFDVALEQ